MADLKPCPFCGFPAVYDRGEAVDDAAHFAVQVVCTNCGASVEGLNRESARIGWNRRASPSPGEGRPEALKDRLLASDWQGARAEARRRVDEAIEASRAGEPWPEASDG